MQCFLFADFKSLNFTWDLKVLVPRIGNSHQELFFKIGFLQLQLFLWNSSFFSKVTSCRSVNFTKNEFRHSFFSRIWTTSVEQLYCRIPICRTPISVNYLSMAAYKGSKYMKVYLYSLHGNEKLSTHKHFLIK